MRFKFIVVLIFFTNICSNSNGAPHRDPAKGKAVVDETEEQHNESTDPGIPSLSQKNNEKKQSKRKVNKGGVQISGTLNIINEVPEPGSSKNVLQKKYSSWDVKASSSQKKQSKVTPKGININGIQICGSYEIIFQNTHRKRSNKTKEGTSSRNAEKKTPSKVKQVSSAEINLNENPSNTLSEEEAQSSDIFLEVKICSANNSDDEFPESSSSRNTKEKQR